MINLRGQLAFRRGGGATDPVHSDWDIELNTLQGHMRCGFELKNIDGGVRLTGSSDGARHQSRGFLDLDCVTYSDFQLSEVHGPIWVDDDQFLFGAWAEPASRARPLDA